MVALAEGLGRREEEGILIFFRVLGKRGTTIGACHCV
jgi:hypothetical protein